MVGVYPLRQSKGDMPIPNCCRVADDTFPLTHFSGGRGCAGCELLQDPQGKRQDRGLFYAHAQKGGTHPLKTVAGKKREGHALSKLLRYFIGRLFDGLCLQILLAANAAKCVRGERGDLAYTGKQRLPVRSFPYEFAAHFVRGAV